MNLRFTCFRVWLNIRDLRKCPFLPSLAYRKKDKLEIKVMTVDLDRCAVTRGAILAFGRKSLNFEIRQT